MFGNLPGHHDSLCGHPLSPDEELEAGEELGLGRVRVLRLQYGLVHLTGHLQTLNKLRGF